MLFSLLKHYVDTDTALKVSQSVYCFTTSMSHGVENYFPRLWGTGIFDAIFLYWYHIMIFQHRSVLVPSFYIDIKCVSFNIIAQKCVHKVLSSLLNIKPITYNMHFLY